MSEVAMETEDFRQGPNSQNDEQETERPMPLYVPIVEIRVKEEIEDENYQASSEYEGSDVKMPVEECMLPQFTVKMEVEPWIEGFSQETSDTNVGYQNYVVNSTLLQPQQTIKVVKPKPLKKRKNKKKKTTSSPVKVKKKKFDGTDECLDPTMHTRNKYSTDVYKYIEIEKIKKNAASSKCKECVALENCTDPKLIEQHKEQHTAEAGAFKCDMCGLYMVSGKDLHIHILRHFHRYHCRKCRTLLDDMDLAVSHVRKEHPELFINVTFMPEWLTAAMKTGPPFVCSLCDEEFKRAQALHRHAMLHRNPLQCLKCGLQLPDKDALKAHVLKEKQGLKFQCTECKQSFDAEKNLSRHMARAHSLADYTCKQCGKDHKTRAALRIHIKRNHDMDKVWYPCKLCDRVLTTSSMLQRHINRMHTERVKNFQCDYCARLYYTKAEVRSHIMWTHMGARGGHACACGRLFRSPAQLRKHYAKYHLQLPPEKKHPCTYCGKTFATRAEWRRHEQIHSDRKFPCPECDMTFKTQDYVKTHIKLKHLNMTRAQIKAESKYKVNLLGSFNGAEIPSPAVTFPCPQCPRVLASRPLLTRHMRRMHAQRARNFQCDECKRFYYSKQEVYTHIMWAHLQARGGHPCHCGRVLRSPALLRDHMRKKHPAEPPKKNHVCQDCGKAFVKPGHLRRHQRKHTNERFPCPECDMTFKSQTYVNRHYKRKHLKMSNEEIAKTKGTPDVVLNIEEKPGIPDVVFIKAGNDSEV